MPRVFNVAFALAITVTTVMSVHPVSAQLMFPSNVEEVINLWDAQVWDARLGSNRRAFGDEMRGSRVITENGWLVVFPNGGGDLGTLWGPLCIDYSPDQTHPMSTIRHMPVVEDHGTSWHRVEVPDGIIANWWGFQISVYGFECPRGGQGSTTTAGSASTSTSGGGQSTQQTAQQTQTQTTGSVTQTVDVDVTVIDAGAATQQPGQTVIVTQPTPFPSQPVVPPQAFCPLQPDHFAGFFPGTSVFDWSRTAPNGTQLTANGAYYRGNAVVTVPVDHVVDTSSGRRFAGQPAQGPFSAYDLVRCA